MAVVLDAFASYVINLLTEMAREEVGMLLGVSSEIDSLGIKLGDLKNLLADADRKNITDYRVQGWVRELKDAMLDAIDILDLCQLRAMERDPTTTSTASCCKSMLFCLRNPPFAHHVGNRIRALNRKLDDIKERSAQFKFIDLGSYEEHNRKVSSRSAANRETTGEPFRSDAVVGEKIKEDTRGLVEMLTEKEGNNSHIMVVAIVGVGGIGKTTLAREIFNHEAIKDSFDKRIWLSVNQNFDKAELLRTAITLAGGDHRGEKAMAVLQPTLASSLAGKKLLLVMDDVWCHKAWEDVLQTPMVNATLQEGSRVVITTRDVRVARAMKAKQPYHHVDKLGLEDAWSLLKKQVVSNDIDEADIDMLKDIGMQIIAKCDGLPLAVKVMGGLLCQKDRNRSDWEKVLHDSAWSITGMPEELNYAVYLSYENLSPCLKQCFLHYALLPKNIVFGYDIIVGMWICEGFVHGNSLDELEELGRQYYKELIMRNLIEPDKEYIDQYHCSMHDVVRSFGQCVSGDEALVGQSEDTSIISKLNSPQKFLRLCLEMRGSKSSELQWGMLKAQKYLRTLIAVGQFNIKPGDSLVAFSRLRTLHIQSSNVSSLADSLNQLKHLRYLSIRYCDISRLPKNIGKMKFLQLISLRGCKNLVELPDSIVKLGQLRYLSLTGTSINAGIPRGFGRLTNLRKLYGFPAHMCGDWCSLEELGPLSQLRDLAIKDLENVSATSFATKARLGSKKHLTYLTLGCSSRLGGDGLVTKEGSTSEFEQERIKEVFDELCPPPCLESLDIGGYFGQRLPRWMMLSKAMVSLKFLRFLTMDDLAFCTQLPDGLCQLPCLQLLQVDHAPAIKRVGPDFQQPYHHLSHAVVAFPRLHRLEFIGMVEWEEWEWGPRANAQVMPVLDLLLLKRCKLRSLPPGLASHARVLKKMSLYELQRLSSVENLVSIVELDVFDNPVLEKITNLPKLQKLTIVKCQKMKLLYGVPAIQRLELEDYCMDTLPTYLQNVNPRHLLLDCSLLLLTSIATGNCDTEWDKFSHIQHVNIYACDRHHPRKWYVLYTGESKHLETNIIDSSIIPGVHSIDLGDEEAPQVVTRARVPSQAKKKVCRVRDAGKSTH